MSDEDINCPTCGQRLQKVGEKRREQNRLAQQRFRDKSKQNKQSVSKVSEIVSNSSALIITEKLSTGKEDAKQSTRLREDWFLPNTWGDWALKQGFDRKTIEEQAEQFKDYWIAKAGKDARKIDWYATWRVWMRKQPKTAMRGYSKTASEEEKKENVRKFLEIIRRDGQ